MDGTSNTENDRADEKRATTTESISHLPSSERGNEGAYLQDGDHGTDLDRAWTIEELAEVRACDDPRHDSLIISEEKDTQTSKHGDGVQERLAD